MCFETISKDLKSSADKLRQTTLLELFESDPLRGKNYTVAHDGIWLNYSRNHLSDEAIKQLIAFANKRHLSDKITQLFSGQVSSATENRQIWHPLLRDKLDASNPKSAQVHQELQKMEALAARLTTLNKSADTKITDIVCIGIGGSELGAKLIDSCFKYNESREVKLHFVANIDSIATKVIMNKLNPKHCWFLVTSKSFTTFETKQNYETLKAWVSDSLPNEGNVMQRFFAITANPEKAKEELFLDDNTFVFWDFVGGRFSLCSAVGLPIALAYGMPFFKSILAGAHSMDQHFKNTDFLNNLPVMLGLVHFWSVNFMHYTNRAVIPYAQQLENLPIYLQQLEMESLGKSHCLQQTPISYETAPVVWGSAGSNVQHAFFQLLHQGTQTVPVDFITFLENDGHDVYHHNALLANALAQSKSLMTGGTLNNHQFSGNRPSNFILLDALTPHILGALIALFEHKIYTQSVLWNINAFDQWGVELGKHTAKSILNTIDAKAPISKSYIKNSF